MCHLRPVAVLVILASTLAGLAWSPGDASALPSHQAPAPPPAGPASGAVLTAPSHVDRLDVGTVRAEATVEAEIFIRFGGETGGAINLTVEPPTFARVKGSRIFVEDGTGPYLTRCSISLAIDTTALGALSGDLKVGLGSSTAKIPVLATVVPREPGSRKVLVISTGFGGVSDRSDFYRPWFDLIGSEKLEVDYKEAMGGLGNIEAPGPRPLAYYDVILVESTTFLAETDFRQLHEFARAGRRLIVLASDGLVGSVHEAGRIVEPYGLRTIEGSSPDYPQDLRGALMKIHPAAVIGNDPLAAGVKSLNFFRPTPIRVADPRLARLICGPEGRDYGFAAAARAGRGEVVVLGYGLTPQWIGEGPENGRFLRNLLTAPIADGADGAK